MLRIIETMASRRRDIAPLGPETTISTPSPVGCSSGSPIAQHDRNLATIDPRLATLTKSSATPATPWRVVTV